MQFTAFPQLTLILAAAFSLSATAASVDARSGSIVKCTTVDGVERSRLKPAEKAEWERFFLLFDPAQYPALREIQIAHCVWSLTEHDMIDLAEPVGQVGGADVGPWDQGDRPDRDALAPAA
ncbi:hypothetical protein B0H17DRAFT_1333639 [Mycena rosella]|uniref:Uncharacterized protein n=1 Tax=Mycena rosella TaxID=1033263 RepID=A0AAD7D707_MYCRO|nr:hypothetical protein B0H17DRAFT_1333639 [Mycena rosella]